jgi:hypothetical protein
VIVVIDTNVGFPRFNLQNVAARQRLALERAMSEDAIATCDEIDAEIMRVLTEKFLLGAAPGNVGATDDSGARHPCEDSWHGKRMPRSRRRYVSGVRRPCEKRICLLQGTRIY